MRNACDETSRFKGHIFLTITFSTTSATTNLNVYNSQLNCFEKSDYFFSIKKKNRMTIFFIFFYFLLLIGKQI